MKNVIVTLRVFRGQLNHDENGNVTSENQLVKVRYNTIHWTNYMKHLRTNGFSKVTVVKAVQMTDKEDVEIKELSSYIAEVKEAFTPSSKAPKTPEQLEIETLKAQMTELLDNKKPKEDASEELITARAELKELTGNKTYHGWDLETIKEKIEAHN